MIISLNGQNQIGKTTQILKLEKILKDKVYVATEISSYKYFPRLTNDELFNWWFIESSPEVFCDTLYKCIAMRNKIISKVSKPFILLDKGIYNFDARIQATLKIKGLTLLEASNLCDYYKSKYDINDLENVKILLTPSNGNGEISLGKIEQKNFESSDKHLLYLKYENYQKQILKKQMNQGKYQVLDASKPKEVLNEHILKIIKLKSDLFEDVKSTLNGNVNIRTINDFILPYKYKNTLKGVYTEITTTLKSNLLLFLVTGSCYWGNVIDGWSDIDIILVVKKNDYVVRKILDKISSKYDIHIGTTVFSQFELLSGYLDAKSSYALWCLQKGYLQPVFISDQCKIPSISKEIVNTQLIHKTTELLHSIRRMIYQADFREHKKIYKSLEHIVKHVLVINGIIPRSNTEMFNIFSELLKVKNFDNLAFIEKYKQNEVDNHLIKYTSYLLDYLSGINWSTVHTPHVRNTENEMDGEFQPLSK